MIDIEREIERDMFRFFVAFSVSGVFECGFVLVTEIVSPELRTPFGIMTQAIDHSYFYKILGGCVIIFMLAGCVIFFMLVLCLFQSKLLHNQIMKEFILYNNKKLVDGN